MRLALVVCAIAILTGCNDAPAGDKPDGPIQTDPAIAQGTNGNSEIASAEPGELPAAGPLPRFVGKWAANQRSCQSAAWQFTTTSLRTPAGSNCSLNRISEAPGGYDVEAICTAEGPPTSDVLKIRFAESAKAMLFESETIADTGVVYCGRDV